jgi:hypothetical protein
LFVLKCGFFFIAMYSYVWGAPLKGNCLALSVEEFYCSSCMYYQGFLYT